MASSYSKLWVQQNLNRLATNRALEVMQNTGLGALPVQVTAVDGSMVTVKFEVTGPWTLPPVTIPKAESQWVRAPTQVGDFGIAQPAGTFLGGISGLGTGVADLGVNYGNLTTLQFVPVAATSFGAAPSPDQAWVNGPKGSVVSDTSQTATHEISVPTHGTPGTIASTIHNAAGAGATTVKHVLDGVNNSITHALTNASGDLKTIVDGAGNAISHVVPTGGKIGLGALAGSLASTKAAFRNADVSTFQTSLLSARLDDLTKFAAAMVAAGVPNAGAVIGLLASLIPITVPPGSAKTFID